MEEDIQNHSPTVMFRGTPCNIYLVCPRPHLPNLSVSEHPYAYIFATELIYFCNLTI